MWSLDAGRNAFLGIHKGMPNQSFWYFLFKKNGQTQYLNDSKLQPVLNWQPALSNCPELDSEIRSLLNDPELPTDWKNFLSEIFVGRTLGGKINAESKQKRGQAWVGISFQYTSAVMAYIAAYDRWRSAATKYKKTSTDQILDKQIFSGIELSRASWADEKSFAGTHPNLMVGPHGRDATFYEDIIMYADMFIICHEYGHHLLGHTNNRAKSFGLTGCLREWLKQQGLYKIVFERSPLGAEPPLGAKSKDNPAVSQTEELLADLLGLKLAGLSRGRNRTTSVYGAMIGATCALLAEADVKHHWFLQEEDTHPSTSERISILINLMPKLFNDYESQGVGDSVEQLARQLSCFSTACLQSSLHSKKPDVYPAPTWAQTEEVYKAATIGLAVKGSKFAESKPNKFWEIVES